MQITTQIILEKRKPRADGKFPIKLRVTYKRERHYYTVRNPNNESMYMAESDFDRMMGERPREDVKELRIYVNAKESEAREIAQSLLVFTFESFERKYFGAGMDEQDLFSCIASKAFNLRAEGRISTAVTYECTLMSLKTFTGKNSLYFDQIDVILKEHGFARD